MSQGRLVRRLSLASLVAAVVLTANASPAGAAVTIGQLPAGTPLLSCGNPADRLQPTVTSGKTYVAPTTKGVASWTITSWSHNATAGAGQVLTMKVFRRTADPATYTVVAHDGPRPLVGGALNSFPVSIAVKPGDVLGLYTPGDAFTPPGDPFTACRFDVPGESYLFRDGSLADGQSGAFVTARNFRLNITAALTPRKCKKRFKLKTIKKKGKPARKVCVRIRRRR